MKVLTNLPYFIFTAALLLSIPLLLGSTKETKTFGVSGTITFEDASAKGAHIILTSSDENPFQSSGKQLYIEQYLLKSGHFYRKITELGGKDLNVWVKQDGYPAVQVSRVLDTGDDQINFGVVHIPAKLKANNERAVDFFEMPCLVNSPVVSIIPARIQAVRNFYSVKCQDDNTVQFKAEIDFFEGTKRELSIENKLLPQQQLASLFF